MKKIFSLVLFLTISVISFAQPFGNKGYPLHMRGGVTIDTLLRAPYYPDTPGLGSKARVSGSIIRSLSGTDTVLYVFRSENDKWSKIDLLGVNEVIDSLQYKYYKDGGNAFGVAASIGTNDLNPLVVETNDIARASFSADGTVANFDMDYLKVGGVSSSHSVEMDLGTTGFPSLFWRYGGGLRHSIVSGNGSSTTKTESAGGNYIETYYNAGGESYVRRDGVKMHVYYQSGNVGVRTTTDAGYAFDVNGTSRFQNNIMVSSGYIQVNNMSLTASGVAGVGNTNTTITGGTGQGSYLALQSYAQIRAESSTIRFAPNGSSQPTILFSNDGSNSSTIYGSVNNTGGAKKLILYGGDYNSGGISTEPINVYIAGGTETNSATYGKVFLAHDGTAAKGNVGVGTNAPNASALVDMTSTTQGMLPPRMTSTQRDAISSPPDGLQIFCTDCTADDASTGVTQTYSSSAWRNHY